MIDNFQVFARLLQVREYTFIKNSTTQNNIFQQTYWSNFWTNNESQLAVDEKCTHTVGQECVIILITSSADVSEKNSTTNTNEELEKNYENNSVP